MMHYLSMDNLRMLKRPSNARSFDKSSAKKGRQPLPNAYSLISHFHGDQNNE